jgi:hypothetical protein
LCPLEVVSGASKLRRRRRKKYVAKISVLAINIDEITLTVGRRPRSERGDKTHLKWCEDPTKARKGLVANTCEHERTCSRHQSREQLHHIVNY